MEVLASATRESRGNGPVMDLTCLRLTLLLGTLAAGTLVAGTQATGTQATATQAVGSDAADAKAPALPDGEGKALVVASCTQCHGLGNITSAHLDREGWDKVAYAMVDRGATLTDAQIATIVDYLALNFPKHPGKPKPG